MAPTIPGFVTNFFVYESTKSVVVKSWTVGTINRVVQLLIILYYFGWVFLHEKAYQVRDTGIESAVMTKVKGLGTLNNQVVDVADYVYPPQGSSTFCIITNMIITANQTQGRCPEKSSNFSCKTDDDCSEKSHPTLVNGMLTGRCLNISSNVNNTSARCEIQGWCPVENNEQNLMTEFDNFTVFIKNSIRFPLFNVFRRNIPTNWDIGSCVNNSLCPIFKVGYILNQINRTRINETGGEVAIKLSWKCDFDYSVDKCNPQYSFTRLDDVDSNSSKGYNFRFAKYYKSPDGTEFRTLHKAFGIRFEIIVSGNAGKFGTVPFLINLVAALTSVGLATVFCDFILLNFLKGADEYKAKKFEEVSSVVTQSPNEKLHKGSQMSIKAFGKSSNDSGNFSTG